MSERHKIAAAVSAQVRRKNRLVRELAKTPPLTAEQRNEIITAAANIPVAPKAGAA